MIMDWRQDPMWHNRDLVRAIKLAVDREQIVNTVYAGFASVGYDTAIAPSDPYFNKSLPFPKQDLGAAKEALKSAGYPNGVDVGELIVSPLLGALVNLGQVIQQQLQQVNIRMTLRQWPTTTFWEQVWQNKPLYIDYNNRRHPSETWQQYYGLGAPQEESAWVSDQFNAAAAAGEQTTDFNQQRDAYWTCQKLAAEQDTRLIPGYASRVFGASSKLKGVRPNFISLADFTDAYLG